MLGCSVRHVLVIILFLVAIPLSVVHSLPVVIHTHRSIYIPHCIYNLAKRSWGPVVSLVEACHSGDCGKWYITYVAYVCDGMMPFGLFILLASSLTCLLAQKGIKSFGRGC
jgi:hypothetical protein